MPDGIVIFSLRESDIIFASHTARRAISLGVSRISLRSNNTRRKANITEKDDCFRNRLFLVGDGGYSAPLDFSTTPSGCEKSALLETSQSRNAIARFGLLRLNHLRRFSSHHNFCQTKKTPLKVSFLLGGRWWIRTTEGLASRFTVCPLWPLGKSPIFY